MLGISTSWWKDSSMRGEEIVHDILEMGFEGVELEYRITPSTFEQMKSLLRKDLKVLSIHNYFPRPGHFRGQASGDLFLLSSIDNEERATAVKYSARTIEHAEDLEAGVVILHLGRVDMPNAIQTFRRLYEEGKIEQDEGLTLISEQGRIRESKKQKNLDAVFFSLDKLHHEAVKRGVFLGIENRYHAHEIPDFHEIGLILKEFEGGRLRYWHDVGHAAVQEKLGIRPQEDLLDAYSEQMIGIHLHDVKGLDDHLAPGRGDIAFEKIKPFLKPSMIRVLEVHPKAGREALLEAAGFIEEALGSGYDGSITRAP